MKFSKLPPKTDRAKIPRTVWALGFVSLFMDISSEMIHAVLPLFMAVGLGASATAIGITEGAAESVALIMKVFSGMISDRFGTRRHSSSRLCARRDFETVLRPF